MRWRPAVQLVLIQAATREAQPSSAAVHWAMPTIARPSDRSAGLATLRNPQTSSRKPRLRPEKRALKGWGTSALGFHARRARFAPRAGWEDAREEQWDGGLKKDRAPGQRTRSAQSTSLLKPT